MKQSDLKQLVKEELLNSIWLEIGKIVSAYSGLNQTQFAESITGQHSWYSAAVNNSEDIQLSSLTRIFGQLSKEMNCEENLPFEKIFSEKNLQKAQMLSYITSTDENQSYLFEIIKQNTNIFLEIKNNLAPLYREGRLSNDATRGYQELEKTLQEMKGEANG